MPQTWMGWLASAVFLGLSTAAAAQPVPVNRTPDATLRSTPETVIWGYFAAAFPYMLPTSLTISDAAGASATLTEVIVVFGAAAILVIPSLILLYVLSQRSALESYSSSDN